ncbi:MAG: hypothetical protein ACLQUY_07765 [Ktedonobacterales bacterium]
MAGRPKTIIYQAQITLPTTLVRIQATRDAIKQAGGKVDIIPTTTPGLTIVRLSLPESLSPEAILPGIPFFPL